MTETGDREGGERALIQAREAKAARVREETGKPYAPFDMMRWAARAPTESSSNCPSMRRKGRAAPGPCVTVLASYPPNRPYKRTYNRRLRIGTPSGFGVPTP